MIRGGPLPAWLAHALAAADAAGGDRRGRQSAARLVRAAESAPFVDLRVDDHPDPLGELTRRFRLLELDLDAALKRASARTPRTVEELRERQPTVRVQLEHEGG